MDVLLKQVSQFLTELGNESLRPLLRNQRADPRDKQIAARLLLLQWRSRDAFQDFGEFYCMRLLLDEQSALASYFIDLFTQLDWLLFLHGRSFSLLASVVHRFAATCRLLYAAHRLLPRQGVGSSSEEFKRVGRIGRMFSSNELHCRMRQLGFANLDQPGDTLVSLKEELGKGAFATVYKGVFEADHAVEKNQKRIFGDPVAVKMFTNDYNGSGSGISFGSQLLQGMEELTHLLSSDKLLPECSEAAQLRIELGRLVSARHPNIVTPRGYIGKRKQGESGLVMEIMDESLHDYLQKVVGESVPPLEELEMLDLMLEIAKGMQFLHECNLMHRDLKPRNVLLRYSTDEDLGRRQFEVKLADFGLTKLYSLALDGVKGKHTHTAPVGTPCYMAPELRGNAQTELTYAEKVDIFSYGTTCFNILIGNPDAMAFVPSYKCFYEAVKTGQWKQWLHGFDENTSFIVNLVAQCWKTDPSMRPTFATLCLLLQHRLRCVPTFGRRPWDPPPSTDSHHKGLKASTLALNRQYSQACQSIFCRVQKSGGVIDLEVIGRILEKLELSKLPPIRKKVDFSDYAKDVRMLLEAQKSLFSKGHASVLPKLVTKMLLDSQKQECSNNLLDKFMETSDPLILIKGVACNEMFKHGASYKVVHDSPPKICEYFDFCRDEAHSELQVDASLVPLLVGFWTLRNFNDTIPWLRMRGR